MNFSFNPYKNYFLIMVLIEFSIHNFSLCSLFALTQVNVSLDCKKNALDCRGVINLPKKCFAVQTPTPRILLTPCNFGTNDNINTGSFSS